MGSLANLYISQSYTSLIHLGNDGTASATFAELEDGLGNGLGISVNTQGDISASNSVTTLDLIVMNDTELSGAFNLNTYFTASTPAYINSTQPYFTDTVFVTGSYQSGNYPPSIADVAVGWICNGINVTNGVVTAVSQSASGYYITMAGQSPQISQTYTFTGRTSPNAHIYGGLEISENLIVSGTFDIEGRIVVNDNVRVNGDLEVSGSTRLTGSLDVSNDITASNVRVNGTLTAYEIHTIIESSSIIFSSGSNILGDSILDTQTLNGTVIVSGSEQVTGSMGISGDLEVKGNISSSTISGIGNVTTYSQSVDARLDIVEATASLFVPFSQSVDARLDIVEATASLYVPFSTSVNSRLTNIESFTASADISISNLNTTTQSLNISVANINTTTASLNNSVSYLNAFTASQQPSFNALNAFTASTTISLNNINAFTASAATSINNLTNSVNALNTFTASLTSSFATLNQPNNFSGSQTITGSVYGNIITLSVDALTASMDCSKANFFNLTLSSSANIYLNPINILPGQTISLKVNQPATTGSLFSPSTIKYPSGSYYNATAFSGAIDILTFVSYDNVNLYGTSVKRLQ